MIGWAGHPKYRLFLAPMCSTFRRRSSVQTIAGREHRPKLRWHCPEFITISGLVLCWQSVNSSARWYYTYQHLEFSHALHQPQNLEQPTSFGLLVVSSRGLLSDPFPPSSLEHLMYLDIRTDFYLIIQFASHRLLISSHKPSDTSHHLPLFSPLPEKGLGLAYIHTNSASNEL